MRNIKIPLILSIIIICLSGITSAGGLWIEGLYRDTELIKTTWFGNDIVTLMVVLPALILSLVHSKRGLHQAQLVWMGLLGYMVYNYAFYLFGAVFNLFFLLYVAIFSLSIYALSIGLYNIEVKNIAKKMNDKTPVKWISGFLFFISLPLGIIELSMCGNYLLNNEIPTVPTLIFALDLSIVVPTTAVAGFLLWRRIPWGYVLGAMMLVKAFAYGLVLCIGTYLMGLKGTWDPLIPLYIFITIGGFVFTLVLFKNFKRV